MRAILPILLCATLPMGCSRQTVQPAPLAAYPCHRSTGPIVIDGRGDDTAWATAPELTFFIPVSRKPATTPSRGRILWDDERLYVLMEATDGDLRAAETVRDRPVYTDDVLEFFFQPSGEGRLYYNIEINALGTVFDARRDLKQKFDWTGMQHTAQIEGSLNDASDRDKGWTLELSVPFAEMDRPTPVAGEKWNFHLSRYDYDDRFEGGKELSSTAALSKVSFHHLEDWQGLEFQP